MQRAERAAECRTEDPGTRDAEGRRTAIRLWIATPMAALAAALAIGCGGDSSSGSPASSAGSESTGPTASGDPGAVQQVDLVARGRSVYNSNCIACHAMDPAQEGSLGPAVAGSSLELLEARVMHAEYPEGYSPKRPSQLMVAMPHLERELAALHAYLNPEG